MNSGSNPEPDVGTAGSDGESHINKANMGRWLTQAAHQTSSSTDSNTRRRSPATERSTKVVQISRIAT